MGRPASSALADAPRNQRPARRTRAAVAVTVGTLWIWWLISRANWATDTTPQPYVPFTNDNELLTDWDLIEPSEDLHWVPCFRVMDEFLCARLTVPLDYNRPLHPSVSSMRPSPKVHIALIMLPGRNHTESGSWSDSPLLTNPGGPGGSGVALVLHGGRAHQEIAGPDLDMIGFDPRGIGATTPRADCFSDMSSHGEPESPYGARASKQGSVIPRAFWMAENAVVGLPNTSSTTTEHVVFRQRGLTKLCNTQDHPDSILRYAGTPNVANDMLSIVQAWDKWTTGLGQKPADTHTASLRVAVDVRGAVSPRTAKSYEGDDDDDDDKARPPSTRGKLVYWGFSYGTVLGATFATMFPEHVGRMVLDGVVNSDEWYFENSWINAVQDTDKVIERFQLYCFQAQERCHLYRKGDQRADVQERFASVLNSLAKQPRVYVIKGSTPVYISYSTIKTLLFGAAYVPASFPVVAMVMDALHRGLDLASFMHWQPVDTSSLCRPTDALITYPDDGGTAVLCGDQRFRLNTTRSGLDAELQKMADVSSFGDVIFTISSRCVGWDIDHAEPPSLDWSKFPLKSGDPVNTSFPILFVSNTRDPVTPLRSGLLQSRKFVDAGFIEQKAEGHCSVSMPSLCTMAKIRAYFTGGVVPEKPRFDDAIGTGGGTLTGNWTTCEVDERPWGVPTSDLRTDGGQYTAAEVVLLQAGRRVQRVSKHWTHLLPMPHGFERLLDMDESEAEGLFAAAVAKSMSVA